jgi:hypothetical protein
MVLDPSFLGGDQLVRGEGVPDPALEVEIAASALDGHGEHAGTVRTGDARDLLEAASDQSGR